MPRWTTTAPAWQPAHQTGPSRSSMCATGGRSLSPTSGGKRPWPWTKPQRAFGFLRCGRKSRAAPGVVSREDTWSRPADCLSRCPGLMGPGASLTSAAQTPTDSPGVRVRLPLRLHPLTPDTGWGSLHPGSACQVFGGYCCVQKWRTTFSFPF